MIKLASGDKEFHIERADLEALIQAAIAEKMEESKHLSSIVRSGLKAAAEILLSILGMKPQKGVDKLEYLAAYVVHVALNVAESRVLDVQGISVHDRTQDAPEGVADDTPDTD